MQNRATVENVAFRCSGVIASLFKHRRWLGQ